MQTNNKSKGFTIVELIVVIAIIVILAAVAIPTFTSIINRSRLSVDMGNLYTLNSTTTTYRYAENITSDDVFDGISTDESRMQKLVDRTYLNEIITPQLSDTTFYWSVDSQKWLYSLFELAGESASYIFKGLNVAYFTRTGTWKIDDDGFTSAYGKLYIDNNNSEYTINTTAQLDEGTGGGYGILFETSMSDPDHDTGYVLQFDRGYNAIVIRPRIDGSEKSPALVIRNKDNSLIPTSKDSTWWSDEHEITMSISDNGDGTKTLTTWIDGTAVISDWSFDSTTESDNNFTGFRSWGDTTVYKEIEIE